MVSNVSQLYTTVSTLPVYEPAPGTTRVLHVSDLHLNPTGWQLIRTVVEQFDIDVVIDTGDITDWGSEPEASFVARSACSGSRTSSSGATTTPADRRRGGPPAQRDRAGQPTTTVAGLTIAGIGDPQFTPDKNTSPAGSGLTRQVADQ